MATVNYKCKQSEGLPPQIPDICHMTSIKMLGITMTHHVLDVISKCVQSLHALKLLIRSLKAVVCIICVVGFYQRGR